MSNQTMNEKNSIILKVEQLVKQDIAEGCIRKYLGYINARGVLDILSVSELEANPRRPKINEATEAIQDTLESTPELMACKTKGLLISSSVVDELERNRLRLSFDPDYRNIEDVLDGGHNLFAISTFIIEKLLVDDPVLFLKAKKIRDWADLKVFWNDNNDIIMAALNNNGIEFNFKVPIEIITVPELSEESLTRFMKSVFDISQARNNNVQLSPLASNNQRGVFDVVKESLPSYMRDLVAWTSGEADKVIKGEYVLALVSFIFIQLQKKGKCPELLGAFKLGPSSFYSGRGKMADSVADILEVWKTRYEANNLDEECLIIKSSLALLKDMPLIWDNIELAFPSLYNKFGGSAGKKGAYGRLAPFAKKFNNGKDASLKKDKPCRFHTPTCIQRAGTYESQDGYVAPLQYTIMAFMEWDEQNQTLVWRLPVEKIVEFYTCTEAGASIESAINQLGELIVGAVHGDPQQLGKANYAYNTAMTCVEQAIITRL